MTTPHIHEDAIKAWAEGYEIEAYSPERDTWIPVAEPGWFPDIEYRVKPGVIKPKKSVFAEYFVRVDIDPFDEENLDMYNTSPKYNLRLLFRNDELVEANPVDTTHDEIRPLDDCPW